MYKIVRIISVFLRTFIFSNPFTRLFEVYLANTMLSSSAVIISDIFNLIGGGIIFWIICFPLVGIVYNKGESPVVGSMLYLVFVLINSGILSFVADTLKEVNFQSVFIFYGLILLIEFVVLNFIRKLKVKLLY